MGIGQQFSGLDMKNLIGAPLGAASDASIQLAQSTADFINNVGFDKDGKSRTAAFKFNQMSKNEDGSMENQEMNVEVPLLAIVPIPNLQIDEVNVLFDMEVKQNEVSESSTDYGGSFSGSARIGFIKISVSGSVASHSSNTRSSDNSAKYHVDVSATNHGTPEGLARVLDMMAANVSPTIASSTAVDESGKPLIGKKKSKNDTLKRLRLQKSQLESSCSSAEKAFDTAIINFKREGSNRQNSYSVKIQTAINSVETAKGSDSEKAAAQKKVDDYTEVNRQITECWNNFQNSAKDNVISVASADSSAALTEIFVLEGVDDSFKAIKLTSSNSGNELTALDNNYQTAVKAYKTLMKIRQQLNDCETKYNEAIYGITLDDNDSSKDDSSSEDKNISKKEKTKEQK